MKPTIKIMDESLANKIAAGEVVQRPVSVVKETIENSIDAQANYIKIELLESGIKSICISDNGIGVSYLDLPLMFKRHATSKIKHDIDLLTLQSLGFRGEALASISAVSEVVIKSSIDGVNGYKINNQNMQLNPCSVNQGCIIKIDNLFYNTPVRFKHLSNPYYELNLIQNLIKQYSLIYPEIKFELINNNKLIYKTDGLNNIKNIFTNIYGINNVKYLENINVKNDDFNINIYYLKPFITRANKKEMLISVNKRLINNKEISNAILEGFKGFIHTNQYPIIYVDINLDSSLLDVNIHPTKQYIKLSFLDEICHCISKELQQALHHIEFIPEFNVANQEANIKSDEIKINDTNHSLTQTNFNFENAISKQEVKWQLPQLRYIGSLYQTYLLFENEEGLYFLDQHAAQERINYEKYYDLIKNKTFLMQELLIPITIKIDDSKNLIFQNHYQKLDLIGIKIQHIDNYIYQITAIDQFYQKSKNLMSDILKIVDIICEKQNVNLIDLYEDISIMMACKSSIKAHQYLNSEEVYILLEQLNQCHTPFTCPHGRPIFNKISNYEIEKMFKRIS